MLPVSGVVAEGCAVGEVEEDGRAVRMSAATWATGAEADRPAREARIGVAADLNGLDWRETRVSQWSKDGVSRGSARPRCA